MKMIVKEKVFILLTILVLLGGFYSLIIIEFKNKTNEKVEPKINSSITGAAIPS